MLLSVIDRYRTQPNASTCGGASRLPLPLDRAVDVAYRRKKYIYKPITMKKKRKEELHLCRQPRSVIVVAADVKTSDISQRKKKKTNKNRKMHTG